MKKIYVKNSTPFPFGESLMKCFAITGKRKKKIKKHDNAKLTHQEGKILQPPCPTTEDIYTDSGFVMNHKEGQRVRMGLCAYCDSKYYMVSLL